MLSVLCIYFETVVSYKRTHGQLSVLRSSGRFSYRNFLFWSSFLF